MTFETGKRLGPYEITGPLGAGGMGEVYQARDTRLDRTVAIKVLSRHLSEHPAGRERFEREARTISNLSHPHICALYDVGHENGTDYLVMEYIEGETLADRLAREKLQPGEVLRVGVQMADALDTAHRSGVVHRDLKPGNVMLTKTGAKLLDFGLAKAAEPAQPTTGSLLTQQATQQGAERPLTAEGTILGTIQYMSPEQLEGKPADARTDLFALGAILYEMATGQRAFHGDSQASLIASILKEEPRPIGELQPMTPPALDHLVRACMAKDPDERVQTAHDVKLQLGWIAQGALTTSGALAVPSVGPRRAASPRLWMGVALVSLVALAVVSVLTLRRESMPIHALQLSLARPAGAPYESFGQAAISPDGKQIVFVGRSSDDTRSLWVRGLDEAEARQLPDTEGASLPFWSPDGRLIAFFADGKLKKVSAAGGPAQALADAEDEAGGTWNEAGVILFAPTTTTPLMRIPAGGGVAEAVTVVDTTTTEHGHIWPSFLPDGRHFIFLGDATSAGDHFLKVGSLDSKEIRTLVHVVSNLLFVPPDWVFFGRSGTLVAQHLDLDRLELVGEPVAVAEQVVVGLKHHHEFTASHSGILIHRSASPMTQLVWFDRLGRRVSTLGEIGRLSGVSISPDEKQVAVSTLDREGRAEDVWLYDLERESISRFTLDDGSDYGTVWSPDGSRLAFTSSRTGPWRVYVKSARGFGQARLMSDAYTGAPLDWSPDGRYLVLRRFEETEAALWILDLASPEKIEPLPGSARVVWRAQWSPDGRWIAYDSGESGSQEVYAQSFPEATHRAQLSLEGGVGPRWRADGAELFYMWNHRVFAVEVDGEGAELAIGNARELFRVPENVRDYDVSDDGERFLMVTNVVDRGSAPMTVMVNWEEVLAEKLR